MAKRNMSIVDRLFSKSVPNENGCLIWNGFIDRHGYGRFRVGDRVWRAHRAAWALTVGEIPEGLTIDHLCRVPLCINPKHMEPVTLVENIRRVPLRKVCKNGHPFSAENTYHNKGIRKCRACNRDAQRRCRGKQMGNTP